MKFCPCCKKKKRRGSFAKERKRKDGLYVYCRSCQKGKYKRWFKKNGRKYNAKHSTAWRNKRIGLIRNLKVRPCSDCGKCYPYYVMDFDHVRGNKYKGLAMMRSESTDKILSEIAKCELVCANCHRIRTHNRRTVVASKAY